MSLSGLDFYDFIPVKRFFLNYYFNIVGFLFETSSLRILHAILVVFILSPNSSQILHLAFPTILVCVFCFVSGHQVQFLLLYTLRYVAFH